MQGFQWIFSGNLNFFGPQYPRSESSTKEKKIIQSPHQLKKIEPICVTSQSQKYKNWRTANEKKTQIEQKSNHWTSPETRGVWACRRRASAATAAFELPSPPPKARSSEEGARRGRRRWLGGAAPPPPPKARYGEEWGGGGTRRGGKGPTVGVGGEGEREGENVN